MIRVVNIKNYRGDQGHGIMRGTPLGNPFRIGPDGDRDTVIEKYRGWLWGKIQDRDWDVTRELEILRDLADGGDLDLVCCCAPLRCHGDVIKACLEWMVR